MKITWDDAEVKKNLEAVKSKANAAARGGIKSACDTLLTLSTKEVPLDTGQLSQSGHVEMTGDTEGIVAYNKEYAAFQHEGGDSTRRIKKYQNGRKKKYLEDPLYRNQQKLLKHVADTVKAALGL